jgi:hypothetical protein
MQHLKTTIHKENLKKLKSGSKQQTIAQSLACSSVTDEQEFYFDLCNSMVSSNIPLTKLNNNVFKSFLQKYTGRHVFLCLLIRALVITITGLFHLPDFCVVILKLNLPKLL